MPTQSVISTLGGTIQTGEIDDGAVTYNKLASTALQKIIPVGVILPFLKSYTNTPALPGEFVECNGQTLSDADSVYNGQVIPDLNSGNRFLRGNSTSGGTGGTATHTHTESGPLGASGDGNGSGFNQSGSMAVPGTHSTENNEPPYYNIVWVMRIK